MMRTYSAVLWSPDAADPFSGPSPASSPPPPPTHKRRKRQREKATRAIRSIHSVGPK